jgi:hypothetical protein
MSMSQFSAVKSLSYLMIGIGGAAMAGSGQYLVDMNLKNARDNCIKSGASKASCESKYKSPFSTLNKVLMYGGCGFVLAGFIVVWFLTSSMMGGRGYGGGMGMMGMGGMGY